MKGRELIDLHGHTFIVEDYSISIEYPTEFVRGAPLVFTSSPSPSLLIFILVKHGDKEFGFITYSQGYYIYGKLEYISYDPKKDMRYVKEEQ